MERAARTFRIGWPAAASLLVNALIVMALLGLQMSRREPTAATAALTVVSLAVPKGSEQGVEDAEAAPATPEAPAPAVAPAPLQPAAPVPVEPQRPVVQPVSPPPVPGLPAVAAPAAVTVTAGPATPAAPAAPRAAAGPSAPAPSIAALRKGAADGLDSRAPAGASRSYAARIRSWLYAHKTYPRRARMRREEGLVQVRFVLDRQGTLLEGVITRRSGNEALDQEAQAMMHRASPYPRAPADLPGERIEFTAPIEFSLAS